MNTIKKLANSLVGRFGFQIHRTTPIEELISFRNSLTPVDNGFELIRAGAPGDGGYLVPDDFIGVSHLISGGCDDQWSFEKYFIELSGMEVTIVDKLNKKPKDLNPKIKYIDAWIGEESSESKVAISDLICDLPEAKESDLMMQLDIEGAEFMSILALSTKELDRFRILVIEFHGLDRIMNHEYFKHVVSPCMSKILNQFHIVHAHANNCCGTISVGKEKVPRVLELTFHNKNRSSEVRGIRGIPHNLDAPNDQTKKDIHWDRVND